MSYDTDFMSHPATTASYRDAQARAKAQKPQFDASAQAEFLLNRPPAPTWNRLKMNDSVVAIDAPTADGAGCVTFDVPEGVLAGQFGVRDTSIENTGDQTLADAFDAALAQADPEHTFEMGAGADATAWLEASTSRKVVVVVPEDAHPSKPLLVNIDAADGAHTVAAVDVVAKPGSSLTIFTCTNSPSAGAGAAGTLVRVIADAHSNVAIRQLQTLDSTYQNLDNVGALTGDDAHIDVQQIALGARQHFDGTAVDLLGLRSSCNVDARYLGHDENELDYNYVLRQRGAKTHTYTFANGVLADKSQKLLRDTIDLIHGGKGAVGREKENVLLTSDDVRNKSLPAILCDEDDVQGDHGASIGHVNPEQRDYMQTRGLTLEQIEDLFESAAFDYAADHAIGQRAHDAVDRLAVKVLGHTTNEEA